MGTKVEGTKITTTEGQINIKVIALGSDEEKVQVSVGDSVQVVLGKAEIAGDGLDIYVNDVKADVNTELTEDSVVTAMPNIEGGLR